MSGVVVSGILTIKQQPAIPALFMLKPPIVVGTINVTSSQSPIPATISVKE